MRKIGFFFLLLSSVAAAQNTSGPGFPPSSLACNAALKTQTYKDTTNNLIYTCVNISGVGYIWQLGQSPVLPVTSAPTGSCTAGIPNQQVVSTGVMYSCQKGTWGVAGGSGTVNSGTTGQIAYYAGNGTAVSGIGVGINTPEFYGAKGDGITNDTAAIQSCWNYSSTTNVSCKMFPVSGTYLVNGQLVIKTHMYVEGKGSPNGTIIKSEYNGDAVVIDTNPVQGVTIRGIELLGDPTLASQRGFHIQGVDGGGGNGGLWDSIFDMIDVDNFALEGLWLDGGYGASYTNNLPNQFLQFRKFNVNGPTQSHTANLIKLSGQVGQVQFIGGQVNGDANWATDYPNPLVSSIAPYSNQAPYAITFEGFTVQSGVTCLSTSYGVNINYLNGYLEQCGTGSASSFTQSLVLRGNHFANTGTTPTSGAVFSFGSSTGTVADNTIGNDASHNPTAIGKCANTNTITFGINSVATSTLGWGTSACGTIQQPTAANLTVSSPTVYVNGDGGATPITTITSSLPVGTFITLYAAGNSIVLGSGGNISFGSHTAPLTVAAGTSVTLRVFDLGINYLIVP